MSLKTAAIRALNAFGLTAIAMKLNSNEVGEDDQADIAQAMAAGVNEEVKQRMDNDPLFLACKSAGIGRPEDITALLADRAVAQEYLAELRADAYKEAVRLYGSDTPEKQKAVETITSRLKNQDAAACKADRDSWRAEADTKFAMEGGRGGRKSAPHTGAVAAVDKPAAKEAPALNPTAIFDSRAQQAAGKSAAAN